MKKSTSKDQARSANGKNTKSKTNSEYNLDRSSKSNTLHHADLAISVRYNDPDSSTIPVYCMVTLSSIKIDAKNGQDYTQDYTLRYKQAELKFNMVGFEKSSEHTSYTKVPSDKTADELTEVKKTLSKARRTAGHIGGGFKNNFLDTGAKLESDITQQDNNLKKINIHRQVTLVESLPNCAWRIGDVEYGDPRKSDGYLEGPYIFHDESDPPALFHVKINEINEKSSITANISISLNSKLTRITNDTTDKAIEKSDEESFAVAFKERLRAISLMKYCVTRNEFIIARAKLTTTKHEIAE
jgi:hypothetical protein